MDISSDKDVIIQKLKKKERNCSSNSMKLR